MIRRIVENLQRNRLSEATAVEDMDLIKAYQEEGDEYALKELIDKYQDLISKMTKKYFLVGGDRDDLEQIALIEFWKAVSSFNGSGDFEAFAAMYIKRGLVTAIGKESTNKEVFNQMAASIDAAVEDGEGGETTIRDTLRDKQLSPEGAYMSKEAYNDIKEFMKRKLSSAEKEVVLRYVQGYSLSEIADELDMKYKSVENAMMRVRNKLNDYVNSGEYNESDCVEPEFFTEEEIKVLESVLNEIDSEDKMKAKLMTMWDEVKKGR